MDYSLLYLFEFHSVKSKLAHDLLLDFFFSVNVFTQEMQYFTHVRPLLEVRWDHGDGGREAWRAKRNHGGGRW